MKDCELNIWMSGCEMGMGWPDFGHLYLSVDAELQYRELWLRTERKAQPTSFVKRILRDFPRKHPRGDLKCLTMIERPLVGASLCPR